MRRNLAIALVGLLGLGMVLLAGVLMRDGGDRPPAPEATPASSPTIYGDDVVEVVVMVDEGADPAGSARAVGLITDATRMWETGLAGLSEEGEPLELVVREEQVPADGTLLLEDPEIVFVVASGADSSGGATLDVADRAGAGCASYADAFALGPWTAVNDFASHHRLPEGTLVTACGPAGNAVCFAVNATFTEGGVDPMEAFSLVGDELGHCLRRTRPSA